MVGVVGVVFPGSPGNGLSLIPAFLLTLPLALRGGVAFGRSHDDSFVSGL